MLKYPVKLVVLHGDDTCVFMTYRVCSLHVREHTNTHAKERIEGEREHTCACIQANLELEQKLTLKFVTTGMERKKKSKDHKFFTSAIKHFTALSNQMGPDERF